MRLEVEEMKMYKRPRGHTIRDHMRNRMIREKSGIKYFTERCRRVRLLWFGPVKRSERRGVRGAQGAGDGPTRKKTKREKLRWLDCVRKDLKRGKWTRRTHRIRKPGDESCSEEGED